MFTGLVEQVGTVEAVEKTEAGVELKIAVTLSNSAYGPRCAA